jgi:putative SOS response-associated peptidase YedK
MCGRYRLTAKERWLSEYFNLDPEDIDWAALWNIAPTDEVATIRQDRNGPKRIFAKIQLGTDSVLGERQVLRSESNQRCLRDGCGEASFQRVDEETTLLGS